MTERPLIWDLYCGAGGAAWGYHLAGCDVVGFDVRAQPRYPFAFEQLDALHVLRMLLNRVVKWPDAIHASPPCQVYSALATLSDNPHPDLLAPTRDLLERVGLPYVIENVPGAPMRRDYVLCGSMFNLAADCQDGKRRQLRRHRWFETNWPVGLQPSCVHVGEPVGVYGDGGAGQMTRGYKGTTSEYREAMQMPWATRREIAQAIPPAYTEFIGEDLVRMLTRERAA